MNIFGYAAIGLGLLAVTEQAFDLDHIDLMDIAFALFSMAGIIVLKCSITYEI
mgnify:CR=1 FL=1